MGAGVDLRPGGRRGGIHFQPRQIAAHFGARVHFDRPVGQGQIAARGHGGLHRIRRVRADARLALQRPLIEPDPQVAQMMAFLIPAVGTVQVASDLHGRLILSLEPAQRAKPHLVQRQRERQAQGGGHRRGSACMGIARHGQQIQLACRQRRHLQFTAQQR